jgi:hypothetical protein
MNPTYSGGFVGTTLVVFEGEIVVVKLDKKKSILKIIKE